MTDFDADDDLIVWLLSGEPWTRYLTKVDLLGRDAADPDVLKDKRETIADPRIRGLIDEVRTWPWSPLTSHKNAGHAIHKLTFLADLGLSKEDLDLSGTVSSIRASASKEGPFQVTMKISESYGGSGKDECAWALCDAPLLTYALVRFGCMEDKKVAKSIEYLISIVRPNGWPCTVSPRLGKFRGPGRKDDMCPYATLVMLKLISELPEVRDGEAARAGAEALLELWAHSKDRHPYMFYAGTDFRKLKAPFVWYDILHVAEVLTKFPWLHQDGRLKEMVRTIEMKADSSGRFVPESVWSSWKDWEFGQKKEPSRWLTLMVNRILNRY
jgi:hypothetical protein